MRTEIYIENQSLDLYKDISAEFTYNIDDVKDFSSRNTNFSKTIVIPGNATNNKLFGHIFEFGNSNFYNPTADNVGYNFNAAKSAACVVYVDKIQIFKGVIRLLEIIIDNGSIEYECAVFGELGGLVSAIGNKKIEDLDFSAYNHVWERDNIVNSWNQASGSTASGMGYYYPLIDYGQVSTNKVDYSIRAFRPALFVREYIDKIITGAGYTWSCAFFNTNLFKRLIVPNNQKLLSTSSKLQLKAEGLYPDNFYTNISTATYQIYWDTPTKLGGFLFNGYDIFQYTIASTLNATAQIYILGNQNIPDQERAYTVLEYYKNSTLVSSHFVAQDRDDGIDRFIDIPISVTNSDTIEFKIKFTGVTDFVSLNFTEYRIEINTSSVVDTPLASGELIEINKTIPKGIYQKDFLSSIVKMFNLYITEDRDKVNHLNIEPYIDFYDFNDVQDWSLKIDKSKPFKLKPMSELNGRYFEFKYKSDSDFYNESYQKKYAQGYADIIEDTGYEFAQEKQTNELIFASSPLIGYADKDKIVTTIYKKSNTQNVNNTSEDLMDSIIRILQVRKLVSVANWHIKNEGGSNIGGHLNVYGYAGHLDNPITPTADINFGAPKEIYFTLSNTYPSANVFNSYWSDYVAEITDKDSKLLTCNVRLTDIDIYNLDFSQPIWIDGSLWRLNKVMDYNPMVEDTTKCEFIKVIEKTYA
jgi:hypothetical protein